MSEWIHKDVYLKAGEHTEVRLGFHDHRMPWMPDDYDSFSVYMMFDDGVSDELRHVSAINRKAGLHELARRWEVLAKALHELAEKDK